MFAQILCVALALVAVQANGNFVVLHSPDSVSFNGHDTVCQSLLKEVFTAALGFTAQQKSTWSGISINDPFNLPEAVVSIVVEGVPSIDTPRGISFPLDIDESEETTWQAVSERLEERDNGNTIVRINLDDGYDALGRSSLGELTLEPIDESSLKYLSLKVKADKKFLDEIQLLRAIAKKTSSAAVSDEKADLYWFVLSAYASVLRYHGADSAAAKEALGILNKAISSLSNAFMDAYGGKVMIALFTNDGTQVRHTRAASTENLGRLDNITGESSHKAVESVTKEISTPNVTESIERKLQVLIVPKSDDINISKAYDSTYPVIFNIFLWFGVVLIFSLIAICITIGDMDPGRDSIIYRMTSNRMKKDN